MAAPDWWGGAHANLIKEQTQKMEALLGPIKKDVEEMKGDIKRLDKGQQDLEIRVRMLEEGKGEGTGAGTSGWEPTFVDIKGFCEFKEVETKGITRPQAKQLVQGLTGILDPSLQPHIRELQLRASRNYAIRVPITPTLLREIKNTWTDYLKNPENAYEGRTLWVQAQRPPAKQKRYDTLGKVLDWAESSLDGALEPKAFWSPDFKVMITTGQQEGPMGVKEASLLCEVLEHGEIKWDPTGLGSAGLGSAEAANGAVAKHRRKR